MPKERNFNPVQAQRKADKAKAIKKGKSEQTARRNEKLAKRNPERLQKQIDDLKQITTSGGKLTKHEESLLEGLERDLKAVTKAREALGEDAPTFGRGGSRSNGPEADGVLGKRRRGFDGDSSSGDDVPDDVKNIPMPRDTPPPIPKAVMDEWYAKRRARRANANDTPLGDRNGKPVPLAVPQVESKTTYEAAPVIRDLRKEAVSAFVPTAVRLKMDKGKGRAGLMEPEEADQLEREGYLKTTSEADHQANNSSAYRQVVSVEDVEDDESR